MNWSKNSSDNALPRRAIVLGAGVVGVATAYALARRGVEVTIIDRAAIAGSGASFANGAQLSYIYTDALASNSLLKRLPFLALGLDSSFRLRPNLDPGQIVWFMRFLRNCTHQRFLENSLAGLQLGLESQLAMHALLEQHKIEFGHQSAGKMLVYDDAAAFQSACEMVSVRQKHGAKQEILTATEAVNKEAALAERTGGFVGAVYSPQEELGDPHKFCNALLSQLVKAYGVQVRMATEVESWEADSDTAIVTTKAGETIVCDQLVMCAGIDAANLLKKHGLGSSLMPMKGYSFTAAPGQASPKMSITDVSRKVVFCPLDGAIRVAGLAELGARDTIVDQRQLAALVSTAAGVLPRAADYAASYHGWAGIRPMTANALPIIRKIAPRVTINVGHGMLGWTYAMGSAERAARLLGGV
ncbi:FAD-dependent oxidoreductase [Sphingorhabdus sp.]|jgi:D-amino-acid dehydrogenase|uniref:FAD-dependent oxidoreductase n=1 Tax=Sphingorhabdus sp. TaxID=1902408 RepID=UPI0037CC89CE